MCGCLEILCRIWRVKTTNAMQVSVWSGHGEVAGACVEVAESGLRLAGTKKGKERVGPAGVLRMGKGKRVGL